MTLHRMLPYLAERGWAVRLDLASRALTRLDSGARR